MLPDRVNKHITLLGQTFQCSHPHQNIFFWKRTTQKLPPLYCSKGEKLEEKNGLKQKTTRRKKRKKKVREPLPMLCYRCNPGQGLRVEERPSTACFFLDRAFKDRFVPIVPPSHVVRAVHAHTHKKRVVRAVPYVLCNFRSSFRTSVHGTWKPSSLQTFSTFPDPPYPVAMSSCSQQIAEQSSSRIVYGPSDLRDGYLTKIQVPTEPVLYRIGRIYRQVNKINEELPGNGFCFGLLDPAANVVANELMAPAGGATTELQAAAGSMEQRSLDGLVAFLTYLFPYLPQAEATAYLDAAGADPLVAAHLVVIRRGLRDSYIYSNAAAVETALRCAAVAAQHPDDPEQFVLGWRRISPDLKSLASRLSRTRPDDCAATLGTMNRLKATVTSVPALDLEISWELARERFCRLYPLGRELPPARAAMKRVLLAKIHGLYLKALGWAVCPRPSCAAGTMAACSEVATATARWTWSPTSSSTPSGLISTYRQANTIH